jgi:hypothetical protein
VKNLRVADEIEIAYLNRKHKYTWETGSDSTWLELLKAEIPKIEGAVATIWPPDSVPKAIAACAALLLAWGEYHEHS